MVEIILVAHGELAVGLLKSAEMIAGPQEGIHAISFYPDDGVEILRVRIKNVLEEIESEEVLVIVDLKGGTPCNVSGGLKFGYRFTLISGMNLAMLLEAILSRQIASQACVLADKVMQAGRDSIQRISLKGEIE